MQLPLPDPGLLCVAKQKLEAEAEDSYLNAQWADPLALKKAFTVTGSVSWRPK